ncbi:MAG: UPF0149 family protein [Gemmatimonadetes bacterium]|nr:UPF0149 family protein [Gemmatimonadota bacterium]
MIKPLTSRRRRALEKFMDRPGHPEGTLTYREMQGFLFAVACAPEMVVPSEWIPRIFGEDGPLFKKPTEAEALMGGLMALFNEFAPEADGPDARLPADCAFRKDPVANLEADAPVAKWCRGFQLGHSWLQTLWDEHLPEEFEHNLEEIVATLTFFASGESAEARIAEWEGSERTLASLATDFRDLFPTALASYSRIGQSLFKASLKSQTARRPAVASPAPTRNEPCPCGSGRKHKKCCGRQVH